MRYAFLYIVVRNRPTYVDTFENDLEIMLYLGTKLKCCFFGGNS